MGRELTPAEFLRSALRNAETTERRFIDAKERAHARRRAGIVARPVGGAPSQSAKEPPSRGAEPGSSGLPRRSVLQTGGAAATVVALAAHAHALTMPLTLGTTGPMKALRMMQDKLSDSVSIKDYGAIGDGSSHPLGSIASFNNLSTVALPLWRWQAIFPFATSLSQEIDGLSIQAAVNTGKAITVPSGTYLCSQAIKTDGASNAIIIGTGKESCLLKWVGGTDGWQHGLSTPATGVFHAAGVTFTTTGESAGSAINVNFKQPSGIFVPIFVLSNVVFYGLGAADSAWTHAVLCNDMPRGLSWNDVAAYGLFNGNTGDGAFRFTCTAGSFGYQFLNVIATGYDWAFVMTYPTSAGPGIEGVEFYNCQAYVGGQGLAFINNPLHDISGYLPPQFNFYACGVQGNGTAVSLIGLQDVVIDNLLTETESHSYAGKPMIDLNSCVDVWVNRCTAGVNPAATHVTFARCNATCFNVNFDQNNIVNYGGMDYAYDWTGNPSVSNVIKEFRTVFRQLPTPNFTTYDRNANQISEAWFFPYTLAGHQITVSQSGTYQVASTSSGTTDAQGEISVTYPVRPITGQPIFLVTPLVTVTPENLTHTSAPPVTVTARSRTGFTVKCLNTGAGVLVGLNYVAVGQ